MSLTLRIDGKVSIDLYLKLREGSLTLCAANAATATLGAELCQGLGINQDTGNPEIHGKIVKHTLFILHSVVWLFCPLSHPMVVSGAHLLLHLSFVKDLDLMLILIAYCLAFSRTQKKPPETFSKQLG